MLTTGKRAATRGPRRGRTGGAMSEQRRLESEFSLAKEGAKKALRCGNYFLAVNLSKAAVAAAQKLGCIAEAEEEER